MSHQEVGTEPSSGNDNEVAPVGFSSLGKRQRLSLKAWRCRPPSSEPPVSLEGNQLNKPASQDKPTDQPQTATAEEETFPASQSKMLTITCTLMNTGNTCYLNSIIHALRYMKEFRRRLHEFCKHILTVSASPVCDFQMNSYHSCIMQLHELFHSMNEAEAKAHQIQSYIKRHNEKQPRNVSCLSQNPKALLDSLRKLSSVYEGNHQHDAHEFLGFLLSCLEKGFQHYEQWLRDLYHRKSTRNNMKAKALSEKQISCPGSTFTGKSLVITLCLECESHSEIEENFRDVCTAFLPELKSADDANDNFTSAFHMTETLRDQEKFWCNFCYHPNEAHRSSQFVELPPELIILLKPSVLSTKAFGMQKSSTRSQNLPDIIPCLLESCKKPCINPTHRFHLSAVVCHIGPSLSCGHYTVYTRELSLNTASRQTIYNQCDLHQKENTSTTKHNNSYTCQDKVLLNHLYSSVRECCEPIGLPCAENQWLHLDDEMVTVLNALPQFDDKNSTEIPYLLFYQKRD